VQITVTLSMIQSSLVAQKHQLIPLPISSLPDNVTEYKIFPILKSFLWASATNIINRHMYKGKEDKLIRPIRRQVVGRLMNWKISGRTGS
jgi:hypothetical protein